MGSLTKSIGGSNAPNSSGDNGTSGTGNVGKDGYTSVEDPKGHPATKNQDVSNTKEFGASLGNEGTNMGSYEEQPTDLNAETGD